MPTQKLQRVIVLGSTGSIGRATLDVVRDFPRAFEVVALSTHRNTDLLARQVEEFSPLAVCISDESAAGGFASPSGARTQILTGESGLTDLIERFDADILVVATVGFAGLFPTLAGIERGMRVALANKEVLVVAGEIVMDRARRRGVDIVPIDSEHNAIWQCLAGNDRRAVRRLILTASGGPFRGWPASRLEKATPQEALKHPTWRMGRKITIDCATMMNKGLEVIEACHLFGVAPERVEVVVHPQSTIHSMVEFVDGSILAQMGQTNMYLPILNALAWPERFENKFEPLDLASVGRLDFSPPDDDRFPCLRYAYEAIRAGGTMPAALNAANEEAVAAFLAGKISFMGIAETIRAIMDSHKTIEHPDLDTLREADRQARQLARKHAGLSA
jgi:1-deoxy-D-xylulose-5-phosphate reductoisomerase